MKCLCLQFELCALPSWFLTMRVLSSVQIFTITNATKTSIQMKDIMNSMVLNIARKAKIHFCPIRIETASNFKIFFVN